MSRLILLTGASSFTGLWIAEALAAAGFEILAPLRRPREQYAAVRLDRVRRLEAVAEVVFDCPTASASLRALVRARPIEALAHHAADVDGYRAPTFDAQAAFNRNIEGAPELLAELRAGGARAVLLTGTVFEAGEGEGRADSPAVTPYGLSKTLTSVAFRQLTDKAGMRFGKFVVASPYGILEEKRFSWGLFRSWFAGETPCIRTPLYVRDHIPVPLLAKAYVRYLTALLDDSGAPGVHRPSGWIAPQGEFGKRLAKEAAARLNREFPLELAAQTDFSEPPSRVNDESCSPIPWDELEFWDDYIAWYADLNARGELV